MEVTIRFAGGPLDGSVAQTDGLDEAKIFFNEEERRVYLYLRIDELVYVYSHAKSTDLTERYDEVKAYFAPREAASLSFIEQEYEGDDE